MIEFLDTRQLAVSIDLHFRDRDFAFDKFTIKGDTIEYGKLSTWLRTVEYAAPENLLQDNPDDEDLITALEFWALTQILVTLTSKQGISPIELFSAISSVADLAYYLGRNHIAADLNLEW